MKSIFAGIFAFAVLCGLCAFSLAQDATPSSPTPSSTTAPPAVPAQGAQSNSGQANGAPRIAPGSVIPVELTKSIDAKKVKTGDEVEAKVTEDMKAGNGEIIVPKNTKIVGKVTEAQARNKEQKESQLGIAFDRAVLKSGGDIPLPMSVQAIISPSYLSGGSNGNGSGSAAQSQSAPSPGGTPASNTNTRNAGTGNAQASVPPANDGGYGETQTATGPRQPITGETQGVLGFPDLKLSNTTEKAQGSVVISEKNNVKLETGTLMLLRVSQ
jgi:hypothetical protein